MLCIVHLIQRGPLSLIFRPSRATIDQILKAYRVLLQNSSLLKGLSGLDRAVQLSVRDMEVSSSFSHLDGAKDTVEQILQLNRGASG